MFLLLEPDLLDYNHLVICARSLDQPEYRAIRLGLEKHLSKSQIRALFQSQNEIQRQGGLEAALHNYEGSVYGGLTGEFHRRVSQLPDPSSVDETKKSFYLFDDCILEKQSLIKSFFSRGRHHGIHCIYISQNYFLLDRRSIRENSSIFFIFRQDFRSISHIYNDHVASDQISLDRFRDFCNYCWSKPHSFLTIDLTRSPDLGKYRRGLFEFWTPSLDHAPSEPI